MSEEKIENLKQQIKDLEARVKELEAKDASTKSASEAMRMILIGPPGAGKQYVVLSRAQLTVAGKGTQAPNIRDKYCICHLVRHPEVTPNSDR